MQNETDALWKTLRSVQARLNVISPNTRGSNRDNRKQPRDGASPERKRLRRSDRGRNSSRNERNAERRRIIDNALAGNKSGRQSRPRPILSQARPKSSKSPTTKTPEAAALSKSAAFYDFHSEMRDAMILGYNEGTLPFKEFTPVISSRFTTVRTGISGTFDFLTKY